MTELRQALNALVDHPTVAPAPIEAVAARGARFVRRRRMQRGAAAVAVVLVAAAAIGLTRQSSDPAVSVATDRQPRVSYTDDAGDAIGPADEAAALDILHVEWAPGSNAGASRGYATSITIGGVAGPYSYISYGVFPSDVPGEQCQLYHLLMPGTAASANAFCGSIDLGTRRLVGRVTGGPVRSTPTASGGTLLAATFDDAALPQLLEAAGGMLTNLSAFTCFDTGPDACGFNQISDQAMSSLAFRVAPD